MNTLSRRLACGSAIAVIGLLAATACSPTTDQAQTTDAPEYDVIADTVDPSGPVDSFSWSLYAEPSSLDYAYANDYPVNTVLSNVCESLFRLNPDLTVSPGLALSVDQPDDRTLVYEIRPDVRFHDGSVMTADDVVASLTRHLDPEVGSYWASYFYAVESVTATGPLEVTVSLSSSYPLFNSWMATAAGTVESAATLAAAGGEYGAPGGDVNCTGPFSLDAWDSGQSITVSKFGDYWDAENAAMADSVEFVFLSDPIARVNAFQSGEVDGGFGVSPKAIAQLDQGSPGQVYFGVNTATDSEIVTNTDGPLGDARVRQALLMATDRAGIVRSAQAGYGEVAKSMIPESAWVGSDEADVAPVYDEDQFPYDPEAAKKLVEDIDLSGAKIVIASTPAFEVSEVAAQAFAQAAQTIGLDAEINSVTGDEYGAFFGNAEAREGIDLLWTSWYISSGDGAQFMRTVSPDSSTNYGGWTNDEFTELFDEMNTQQSVEERSATVAEMNTILAEEVPWLPILTSPTTVFLNDRLTGVAPSIAQLYYPWAAEIGAAG